MAAKIPVGIQLYSLRTVIDEDVPGVLQRIAGMGYECVEFAGYYGLSGAELAALAYPGYFDTGKSGHYLLQ